MCGKHNKEAQKAWVMLGFTTYHFRAIINTDTESVNIDRYTKECYNGR